MGVKALIAIDRAKLTNVRAPCSTVLHRMCQRAHMIKLRPDLSAVAHRVAELFPSAAPGLTREQIEAAIALHAREQVFSEEDYGRLLRLRSQAFKSPDKMIKLLP